MNTDEGKQNNQDGETSRPTEESSSSSDSTEFNNKSKSFELNSLNTDSLNSSTSESDEMKRAIAKKLIERYFYQLSDGCGNPKCTNKNCASSGEVETLSPNQAAARALQLYSEEAELCELHPSKIPRTNIDSLASADDDSSKNQQSSSSICGGGTSGGSYSSSSAGGGVGTSKIGTLLMGTNSKDSPHASNSSQPLSVYTASTSNTSKPLDDTVFFMTETKMLTLLNDCKQTDNYSPLVRRLGQCFSSRDFVAQSFQKLPSAHIDVLLEKAPKDLKKLKKEDFRTLEGDLDKDEDSSTDPEQTKAPPHHTTVDLVSLRRSMQKLYETNNRIFEPLNNALHTLAIGLSVDLRLLAEKDEIDEIITVFVIIFEIVLIGSSEFIEVALPSICKAAAYLPVWAQARLACIWAEHCKGGLRLLIQTLQQMISLQVIAGSYQNSYVQNNEIVVCATKVLKVIYYANILAGTLESSRLREDDDPDALHGSVSEDEILFDYTSKSLKTTVIDDPLALELNVNALDCRKPFLPFEEFYNEPLSDAIKMDNDYLNYKERSKDSSRFSFMLYSFILTPATKTLGLYYDSRIRMYSERRLNIYHTQIGQPLNPYLKLKVRRDQIIEDALIELEVIAMGNPKDLKKQLVVEFADEQGIDEGGVSKEFFQLVVEQIFKPDYGMFMHQEETNTVWFNSTSFENEAQFTLIGIVVGLAIYNNIILAVNFPMVVYRKLMGVKGSFADLEDWNPGLYNSLQSILNYQDNDMEEVFMQTFKIGYQDMFGNKLTHELKANGENIFVNQDNKQEFVDLYTDYLLNSSISKQFRAFRNGFQMVTDESPLHLLFRPEEVELLVCGSKQFDFNELEKATEYECGYTEKSQTIVDFWEIVHALPMESKKKLLEFTTGSDRVPVGGLSQLKLIIARNGPDSDRLPTSHTCFNVLLLPEYTDKAKLEDRLLKAINYSKGFGML